MSVVVEDESGLNTLICKGAVEEVLSLCTRVELNGEVIAVQAEHDTRPPTACGRAEWSRFPRDCFGLQANAGRTG